MKIELKEITVGELVEGYEDNGKGVCRLLGKVGRAAGLPA